MKMSAQCAAAMKKGKVCDGNNSENNKNKNDHYLHVFVQIYGADDTQNP